MKLTKLLLIAICIALPLTVLAGEWKYPTKWEFKGSVGLVLGAAKGLPKVVPLKNPKASKGMITFDSDWGTMDMKKKITMTFTPSAEKKGFTLVDVNGAPPVQAYQILNALGDKLKQPIPAPPKKFR